MTTDTAARPVHRFESLLRARELGIAIVIVLVVAITAVRNSNFLDAQSVQQLLSGAALIALLSVGETMVIITRNVDLSVGSTVGLSAYVVGDLFKYQHIPVAAGFAVGVVLGAVVGAVNGLVTTVLRVPSLVVTLAMLYVIRGVDGVIVSGHTIDPSAIPRAFTEVGYRTLFGVPWLAIIVLVVVAVAGYAMRSFRASRDLYAIGSNPEAAALAGIPAGRRVFTAFVISGTLAGLAGALFLALHA
jgi:rhamnose transport system permease protein